MIFIGCDIESVEPFREQWKKNNKAFFARIFSSEEIAYCKKFKDPAPHFAARFCGKEALVKAASSHARLLVTDIQIRHRKNKSPLAKLWKNRPEAKAFFKAYSMTLSLSHTTDIAMASVVVWSEVSR